MKVRMDPEDVCLFKNLFMDGDYVCTWEGGRKVRIHRKILGLAHDDPRQVDHIDNDPLNNTKANLRIATPSVNAQNSPSRTSLPKGVSYDKHNSRYRAQIMKDGKQHCLGRYDSIEDAAKAYNEAAVKFYGPDAWVN